MFFFFPPRVVALRNEEFYPAKIGSWCWKQVGECMHLMLINWTAVCSWKSVTLCLALASVFWVPKRLLFDLCLWPSRASTYGHVWNDSWWWLQNPGAGVRNTFFQLCHLDVFFFCVLAAFTSAFGGQGTSPWDVCWAKAFKTVPCHPWCFFVLNHLSENDLTPFVLHFKETEQLVLKFGKATGYVKYYIDKVCSRFFALKIISRSEIKLLSSCLKALHIIALFYLFMIW